MKSFLKFFKLVMGNEGGFWIPLAMMAAGMAKNQFIDKPQAKARNMAAAAQTEYSPLTGYGPGELENKPSTVGAGMKWGATGLALNQAMGAKNPFSWGSMSGNTANAPMGPSVSSNPFGVAGMGTNVGPQAMNFKPSWLSGQYGV